MMALNWLLSGKWSPGQTVQNKTAKEQNQSTLYILIKFPVRLIFAKKSDFILEISLPWNKMAESIWAPWKHYKASEKTKFPNQYSERNINQIQQWTPKTKKINKTRTKQWKQLWSPLDLLCLFHSTYHLLANYILRVCCVTSHSDIISTVSLSLADLQILGSWKSSLLNIYFFKEWKSMTGQDFGVASWTSAMLHV